MSTYKWAVGLTGGGDALDGIASPTAGDQAIVLTDRGDNNLVAVNFYTAITGIVAESSPVTITPDINANNITWYLVPEIQSITYAQLYNGSTGLIDTATLVPGRKYKITDFQSVGSYNTGDIEPLIVTAATTSTLQAHAVSTTYPTDIIEYEAVATAGTGTTGRILRRIDTINKIDLPEDWRQIKVRRYASLRGLGRNGEYIEILGDDIVGDSTDYEDVYPVGNLQTGSTCHSITYRGHRSSATAEANLSFGEGVYAVEIEGGVKDLNINSGNSISTAGGAYYIGGRQSRLVILGNGHIRTASCCDDSYIDAPYVIVGESASSNTITGNGNVYLGNLAYANTISGQNVIVGDLVSNRTITQDNSYINSSIYPLAYAAFVTLAGGTLIPLQKYQLTDKGDAIVEATSVTTYVPHQNCSATISPAAGVLSLTGYEYADVITVDGDITSITPVTTWPITIKTSVAMTLTGTTYASISADGQIMMNGNISLDPIYGDYVELAPQAINNGSAYTVYKVKARSIYE